MPQRWLFAWLACRVWPDPRIPAKEVEALTGAPDRTCRSWCDRVEPPAWVYAACLAGDDGERFLALQFGDGGPAWWRALQRAKRLAEAVDRER